MIPKKIHYIWLGGNPLPKIAEKCIDSWKKFCPDYEIIRWDESNLNININQYCREAYDMKKYAFASDVLRFDVLNREGGIYLDIDVELIKNIDKFLDNQFFCGFESDHLVNPGIIMGSIANHEILNSVIEGYNSKKFVLAGDSLKQETVCHILTNKLIEFGMYDKNEYQEHKNFTIYPTEYFCPKSLTDGKIRLTDKTHGIHHYTATWVSKKQKFKTFFLQVIKRILGQKIVNKLKERKNNKNKENKKNDKLRILHVLASNKYSGAENVVCQIIDMFNDEYDFAYSSPDGPIGETLKERNIQFMPLKTKSIREVKRIIKEFNPDIIHAHDPMAIMLTAYSSKKIPIVAHIHSNNPKFKKLSLKSIIFKLISKMNKVKNIIWVSESCFNDYKYKEKKYVKNKSLILNNIINCEKLKMKADSAENQNGADLVYVGRLTYPKNPERLFEIVNLLKEVKPDIKLSVIGDGDLMNVCNDLLNKYKLANNITLHGFLNNGYGILKNSKIFLMTSRFEGNPMCILEAQTFGLPIIVPAIDELKTLIDDDVTGYFYNTNEEAVEKIMYLLNNSEEYMKMKDNIFEFSTNYNNIEEYKEIIRNIYNNK